MSDLHRELEQTPVINAAGKMTYLGGSKVASDTAERAASAMSQAFVMDELRHTCEALAAKRCGAADACVTASAAAGIATAVAAAVTRGSEGAVRQIPAPDTDRTDVLIHAGHVVDFGMDIRQAVRAAGGTPREIGSAAGQAAAVLGDRIDDETAALLYVISHHADDEGVPPLEDAAAVCRRRDVPLIVDAAAEMDLERYLAAGADLVIYSGHKALRAPTSGFIAGRSDLIGWCRRQRSGIGRLMKVGKESLVGLYIALQAYSSQEEVDGWRTAIRHLHAAMPAFPGVDAEIAEDATRPIPRLRLRFGPRAPVSAPDCAEALRSGEPAVYTRSHEVEAGVIQFDPRELRDGDAEAIVARMRAIMEAG